MFIFNYFEYQSTAVIVITYGNKKCLTLLYRDGLCSISTLSKGFVFNWFFTLYEYWKLLDKRSLFITRKFALIFILFKVFIFDIYSCKNNASIH